jgi:glycerol-3-phosphate dehydrogenase
VADTKKLAIGGGRGYPRAEADQQKWIDSVRTQTGLPVDRIKQLFERYGTRAADIAAFIAAGSDQPFRALPSFSYREVIFLAQSEMVVHLDDFLLRRSLIAMLGLTTGDLIEEMAAVLAPVLGWSQDRVGEEIERTVRILTSKFGVPLDRVQVARKQSV